MKEHYAWLIVYQGGDYEDYTCEHYSIALTINAAQMALLMAHYPRSYKKHIEKAKFKLDDDTLYLLSPKSKHGDDIVAMLLPIITKQINKKLE